MRMRNTVTKSMIVAVALATTLTLSGCFANPLEQLVDEISSGTGDEGAEKLIEGMTGSDVDIQVDGTMPQDFPADVPVVEGRILTATSLALEAGKTWMVTLAVADSKAAMNLAREKLLGAGFEESMWSDGEMMLGMFTNETSLVTISNTHDEDNGQIIGYQVLKETAGE